MEPKKEDILIEILQHQVPCSKEEARIILKKHQHNLVSAIKELKAKINFNGLIEKEITVKGDKLKSTLKNLLKETSLIHLSILKDNKMLLSMPVSFSMIIFYLYPLLSTLTVAYFLKNEFTIRVLRKGDNTF